ncbi:phosphonate ABC transporter, permease protein PhnE [Rhodococcus opacus]|uniref:Phosphonate ABC transporter, permease protein PhnE n=1 Tax=Rhodococcus opacus TaxID=37919 RepID=A0A2S8IRD4_RHOOP|nr:phosphonate ABC transporter, permease protein PhnE [Rhodococcus opacus]PQP17285.1 phosphonate ABC transporter, permease protein PhnE [Rhodococcus opacus]
MTLDAKPSEKTPSTTDLAALRRPSWQTGTGVIVVLAVILWSAQTAEFSLPALVDGLPNIADFVGRMFPPDLAILPTAVSLMGETLAIAVIGTAVGVLLALPWALLAARSVFGQAWLHHAARASINVTRAVPELMWALLFVSAVGLGPLAGTLAIIIGSAAGMARLFADIFETMDMRAWEAAAAAGATRTQRISWVLLPQSVPTIASYTLLVLDGNVRAASLLGIVGAGGIGMELTQQLRLFEYGNVLTIVIVVLVVVVALDRAASYLRKKLI